MHTFTKDWNDDQGNRSCEDYGIERPKWITDEITIYDLDAIRWGGCASGSYMPAVTYHKALKTMSEHGDDVIEYIENFMGESPSIPFEEYSWSGLAVHFLSTAVELWADCVDEDLDPVEDYND